MDTEEELFIKLDDRKLKGTMAAVYIMFSINIFQLFSVPVALPKLMEHYDLMKYQALVIAASTIFCAIFTLLGGKIGEKIGRKKLAVAALTAESAVFLAMALKPSNKWVFAALYCLKCAVDGFRGPVHASIVGDIIPKEKRPSVMGIFGTLNGIFLVIGLFVGGILVDQLGPFSVFWITFVFNAAAAVLYLIFFVNKVADKNAKFDLKGLILIAVALTCPTVWANFGGRSFAQFGLTGIILLAATVVFLVLFALSQKNSDSGLLPLSIFKSRFFLTSAIMAFCIRPMVCISSTNLTIFAQEGLNLSASVSGTLALPKNIVFSILPAFLGVWLSKNKERFGYNLLLCGGAIVIGAAVMMFVNASSPLILIYIGMFIFGFGTSAQSVSIYSYAQLDFDSSKIGTVTSGIDFAVYLSSTIVNIIYSVCYTLKYDALIPTGKGTMTEVTGDSFHALVILSLICGIIIVVSRFTTYTSAKKAHL